MPLINEIPLGDEEAKALRKALKELEAATEEAMVWTQRAKETREEEEKAMELKQLPKVDVKSHGEKILAAMHKSGEEFQAKCYAGKRGVKVAVPAKSILVLLWGSFIVEGEPDTSYTASKDVYGLSFDIGDRDIVLQFVDDDQGSWVMCIAVAT